MKLLTTACVAGHSVPIYLANLEESYGTAEDRCEGFVVKIDETLSPQAQQRVAAHELFHIVCQITGLNYVLKDLEEPVARAIENVWLPAWESVFDESA